ncbi:MAG: HDIG domain-containing protein [Firmicutes bacterium]|nr:HDIG domain-containing protein [Bacillota bacterium]
MKNILNKIPHIGKIHGLTHTRSYRFVQAVLLCILIFMAVVVGILPAQHALEEGQIASETIFAPREVIDQTATRNARQEAENAVEDQYERDPRIVDEVAETVTALLSFVYDLEREPIEEPGETETGVDDGADDQDGDLESEPEPDIDGMVAAIKEFDPTVDEHTAVALLTLELPELQQIILNVEALILEEMRFEVTENNREHHLNNLIAEFNRLDVEPAIIGFLNDKLRAEFRPNWVFSPEKTAEARREAWESVDEIVIRRGEKILDQGEVVTSTHIHQLQALGLLQGSVAYGYYAGLAGIIFFIFAVWAYYLYRLYPKVYENASSVLLLGLIIIVTIILANVSINLLEQPLIMPVTMAAMLITILFDVNLGVFFGVSLSLIIGLMTGGEFNSVLLALVGGIVAAFSVTNVNQRSDLTRAGLIVAGANFVLISGVFLLGEGISVSMPSLQRVLIEMLMGVGGGILASIFAIGLLPIFENTFGITTSVRLLELANPNQKPLKRLLLEAPGTYHHSILVGNLAEAAAEVVNADPILARVGAYYHDLGKLSRPYFFIENQFSGDNPHDKIPPSLSSMILTAHVKNGVELANQYKLPPVIRDIIQQHHGDSLIGYFYHRALAERTGKDQLLEEKFRYEGPRPQFKEAGIIMLADSVEAAVRSLSQPNQFRIANLVKKIINDKLADGQLDDCDLTLRELNLIGDAFVRNLAGSHHKRIAYPTEQELANASS